jgi:uncharacterized protein YndB with AHSA1/START domain
MSGMHFAIEPGKQELVSVRVFDAPRQRVFAAYTDPLLVPQWWGPRRYTTRVDIMEARPGGQWRFINGDAAGNEYAFHGVYHAVVPPALLVYTFEYEGTPGQVLLETITFEEDDGKTRLTDHVVFQSVADRDEMLQSDMEEGAAETMDRFAELLAGPSS